MRHADIHLPYSYHAHSFGIALDVGGCLRGWFDRLIDVTNQTRTTCIYISDFSSETVSILDCHCYRDEHLITKMLRPPEKVALDTQLIGWELLQLHSSSSSKFINWARACVELLHKLWYPSNAPCNWYRLDSWFDDNFICMRMVNSI